MCSFCATVGLLGPCRRLALMVYEYNSIGDMLFDVSAVCRRLTRDTETDKPSLFIDIAKVTRCPPQRRCKDVEPYTCQFF